MKILVAGGGSIGKRHAANILAAGHECHVFDLDRARAEINGVVAHDDWKGALSVKPALVIVATPHHTHMALAMDAIRSGADVLVEKPIADRADTVAPVLAAARQADRKVFVACNMRYHPAIRALKDNLPKIGPVYFARAQYGSYLPEMRAGIDYRDVYSAQKSKGGGVIYDAIHEIDYLCWLFGKADFVSCVADKRSALEIDVEDYAALVLCHAGGIKSEIHLDFLQRFKRRGCEIVGRDGTLVWQSEGKVPEECTVRLYESTTGKWKDLMRDPALESTVMYRAMLDDLLKALAGSDNEMLTGDDGLIDLRVAEAAHLSAENRRVIHVL